MNTKIRKLSKKEIQEIAKKLGFSRYPSYSHGEHIFNRKNMYISHDYDKHRHRNFWKVALNSADNLRAKHTREYTADMDLNPIGD